ncbi:MAG: OadG family transporter subunit [Acutalibacteraceae bacterium]
MENLNLCLTILITGFVVVFAVLILLIAIIKIYGTIVSKALSASQERKARKAAEKKKALEQEKAQQSEKARPAAAASAAPAPTVQGISPEIVAVIAAAVDSTYGAGCAKITSIKKSKANNSRPAWGMAGVFENTRPF